MVRSLLITMLLAGCAGVSGGARGSSSRAPVEVVGRVTDACRGAQAQPSESVTLRAEGEPDALDTTQTDESGAFRFRVVPPEDPASGLFIEARGHKALVKPPARAQDVRVAELTLPCER